MASNTKKVPVRVLRQIDVGETHYKPNQLVVFDTRTAARLVKEGSVDDNDDAVEYCVSVGIEPVYHDESETDGAASSAPPADEQ